MAGNHALYLRRRIANIVALVMSSLATLIGLFFLAWILWETLKQGISALSPTPKIVPASSAVASAFTMAPTASARAARRRR